MEKVRTPQCGEGSVGKYKLRSKLGEGSYSTLWKAENLETGQEVAVKQVYLSKLNHTLKNSLDCELTFLSSVNHPNIIRLFDVLEVPLSSFPISSFIDYWFGFGLIMVVVGCDQLLASLIEKLQITAYLLCKIL